MVCSREKLGLMVFAICYFALSSGCISDTIYTFKGTVYGLIESKNGIKRSKIPLKNVRVAIKIKGRDESYIYDINHTFTDENGQYDLMLVSSPGGLKYDVILDYIIKNYKTKKIIVTNDSNEQSVQKDICEESGKVVLCWIIDVTLELSSEENDDRL